ncbi:hypothetical protein LZ30DRAFT_599936, partial [Colletotrichum cereale]
QAKDWVFENPGQATCYAVGAGSLVVLASPALFSSPVLTAVGFGNKGVIAKSVAAGLQSGIGNVVTPSYFATFTSAQMGGYGVAIVNGVVQVGAGAAAVGSGGYIELRGWFAGGEESTESEAYENASEDNQDSDTRPTCP